MLSGHASNDGTARYAARFPALKIQGFYRQAQEVTVSSLGHGTYLGGMDDATDHSYVHAIRTALRHGINFVDTSLNYRHQRSERCVGAAIQAHVKAGEIRRDEFVVCTKAGFLVPGAVPPDVLAAADVVAGVHSMAPAFLADQLERSRENLNLATIDVYYLHNPETQLAHLSREDFSERISRAFQTLEAFVAQGKIRAYGTATWGGYRKKSGTGEGLSLVRLAQIAKQVAGQQHHFRFIQLPFNLAMVEAFTLKTETVNGDQQSVLDVAERAGITVVASATLMQSRLARNLPEEIAARFPSATTDAQRAIQFTRSTPGISVALVGMSRAAHVAENLRVAMFPPAAREQYLTIYQ